MLEESGQNPYRKLVVGGVLAAIDTVQLQGITQWTIRGEVTHKNGKKRESRCDLVLQ